MKRPTLATKDGYIETVVGEKWVDVVVVETSEF